MEATVEFTKKTTILFPPDLYRFLADVAQQRKVSVGQLVRTACESQYGFTSPEERLHALEKLSKISALVASTAQMKRESIFSPDGILS